MFKKEKEYYFISEFRELGLNGIYTKKNCGSLSPYNNPKGLEELKLFIKSIGLDHKKLVFPKQSHTKNIAILKDKIKNEYLDVDGFVTQRKDLVLATFYADCLPIYAYDKKLQVIGLCHSGWLGTYEGIAMELIDTMIKEYSSKVEDIIIQLGIGISGEVYEVGEEFLEKFKNKYSKEFLEKSFLRKNQKLYFDNQNFNNLLLEQKGIKNILTSNLCTYKNKEFHSYRRDKLEAGRNAAILSFK